MKTNTNKNQKSGLKSRPEQLSTGNRPQIDFARRVANRSLDTDKLLALLRSETPNFFEIAEVVGKWVWIQFADKQPFQVTRVLSSSGGVITTWATNGWMYDGLNRVAAETSKDGATTTYGYDALGDVTNQAMPGGLTWSASYLSDGRIATEQEHGGSLTTRTNSYTYYGAGSPFAGLLMTRVDGRGTLTTNLNYDAFLRRTDLNTFGSAPEQNIYRHTQYDAVGNVVWMFESPSYIQFSDTQIVRGYDAYNRVNDDYTEVDRATTSSYWEGFQSWDSAGRRVSMQTGINTSFGYRADGLVTQANGSTFSYANNGLLVTRTTGAKTATVNQRDGQGRVLQSTTTYNTLPVLTENLSYRNDGRLSGYTASRDFTDTRNYSYSTLANRVTQESFGLSSMSSGTNNYTIDNNVAGGLGILTSATESGGKSASWSVPGSGGLDGLSRVAQAQDSLVRRSAIGSANGASTVSASLDGDPLNVQFDGNDVGYRSGIWRLDMDLSPGSHTLNVSAVDATGYIFGSSNSTFSVATNAGDTIQNTYDGNGNVSTRVWVNALGQTNRTQALTWDAFDRLVVVNQRDTNGNGFDWTACYDSLGRRIETICDMVQTNVEVVGPLTTGSTIDSWYDPQVQFEEAGAVVDSVGYWKTLGPDANGVYGGMQGTGGLESVLQDGHTSAVGVVQDYFGDVIGTISGSTLTWNPSRFSSYGPVPGYQSPAFSPEVGLAQSLGWRGKRVDETGLINLGARHYDPVAGRFLNADPLGHSGSQDLYSFCGGDPVNHFDPDGRLGVGYYQGISSTGSTGDPVLDFANGVVDDTFNLAGRFVNGIVQGGATVSDMIGSSATGLYDTMFGTQYQGYYQGYSQTYQNIYNNPNSGPSRGQILLGTGEAELNVATLGAFGMAQGTINGVQTGNWNQAQDASLNALFLSSGTQAMQNAGVNPLSVGYTPNAADQALLSLFKTDPQATAPPALNPAPAQSSPSTQYTQADVQAAIARLNARGIQTSDVQSSIDPDQVIAIAKAMKSGTFQNDLMDGPVIFDPESQAYLAGNHRAIAAEMTGFDLKVNSVPNSVPEPVPFSSVPLQTGRVNPPIKVQ
jgi:RHS repeat-associated protein